MAQIKLVGEKNWVGITNFLNEAEPYKPIYVNDSQILRDAITSFQESFAGEIVYSVKSNPSELVLKTLLTKGVKYYDVASLDEVYLLHNLIQDNDLYKDITLCYMHPIKPIEAIKEAYNLGVRVFSLDSLDELQKILKATDNATDLSLHVRLRTTNTTSAFNLSKKFGICLYDAEPLLKATQKVAKQFGICFHVGSQCMNPAEYILIIESLRHYLLFNNIYIDVLDIGGGFPLTYENFKPLELLYYLTSINANIKYFKQYFRNCQIWSEPGRVLVGEHTTLITRVELVRNNTIYLNDGTYGGLFDAGIPNFIFNTEVYRTPKGEELHGKLIETKTDYCLYGPTCDSLDVMQGPYQLPENIKIGDYIKFYNLGAYSTSLRTNFNGFGDYIQIDI